MVLANTNVTAIEVSPTGSVPNEGWKLGRVDSKAKVAADDTWTVMNAREVGLAVLADDATGVIDACTITTNVIVMTDANAGTHSGFLVYR